MRKIRKKAFPFTIILLFCSLTPGSLAGQATRESTLSFYWSFFQCSKNGQIAALNPEAEVPFPKDQLFKIYLQPVANVYLYLFYYSAEKELTLLFPSYPAFFAENYRLGQGYYIPDSDHWFGVAGQEKNKSGEEKFYLLASVKRLDKLEAVTRKYLATRENPSRSRHDKDSMKQQVLNEIITLQNRNSPFKTAAEKPVMITTYYRGTTADAESLALQVEAESFYIKTVRLMY